MKYFIYVCSKDRCKQQLSGEDMGKKCPYCGEWLYNYLSRKDFEEGKLLTFDDKQLAVSITKYPRHYSFPKNLQDFVEVK